MNKIQLHQQLMIHLQMLLNNAIAAAKRAHDTATSEENIAENKYDTLALEAAYLAQGQSKRVIQCQTDIDLCIKLPVNHSKLVVVGSLVVLQDNQSKTKYLLICPVAGGVKLQWDEHTVLVVTPQSPIGAALLNQQIDDIVTVTINNQNQQYQILQLL